MSFLMLFSCKIMSNSFATSCTVAYQAPLSMRFPRQENWSGLPFPPPQSIVLMEGSQNRLSHILCLGRFPHNIPGLKDLKEQFKKYCRL